MHTLCVMCFFFLVLLAVASFSQTASVTKDIGNDFPKFDGDSRACTLKHNDPDFMVAWSGQPGHEPEYQDSRDLSKGLKVKCLAISQSACVITYPSAKTQTVPSDKEATLQEGGTIQMQCQGKGSTCCKLRVKKYNFFAVIAPTLSETTGTQTQTVAGGNTLLTTVKSNSYCDGGLRQFGLAANASDTSTTKINAPTISLDNNEVRLDATTGIFGKNVDDRNKSLGSSTSNYLGVNADFFGNNSLGIGLQQTYAIEFQHYLRRCSENVGDHRTFVSVGIGAGFMNQRLYQTASTANIAVLPLSAQFSYLVGKPKTPPKLIFYALAGYLPGLNNTHAYQLSGIAGLQIPTKYPWLTVNLTESELYMNNAPTAFRKNYQNGSVALVFTIPGNPPKQPNPAETEEHKGACYGGDKLARLYCFDDVTYDACPPPNMFRQNQKCSASGGSFGVR
jgi:hypothetical protein